MVMRKYYIKTFGCQMNVNDSEIISGQLDNMNISMTSDVNQADIIIFNTCCVREKVEHKTYSLAGKIAALKEEKPNLVFAICGCMAQKEKEIIQKRIPFADLILGPSQASSFENILRKYLMNKKKKMVVCDNRVHFDLKNVPIKYSNSISAFVQIMKGCNNYCSYCIVPYTRGPEESRSPEEILKEINNLSKMGYKEIYLLGQNVNSYGNDMVNGCDFLNLLRRINDIKGIERIRFTTSHPKDFNLDLIRIIKDCEKICEHIHLPIQSGSDNILKKMKRKYDMKKYQQIIKHIRENMPKASISTDVMVGFPGETEEDFLNTIKAFKDIQFDSAYTFIYSNRENTLSSLFNEQIALQTKKERLWKLIELQKNISTDKNKKIIGQTVEILVENHSKKGIKNQYFGKTRTNKAIVFNFSDNKYFYDENFKNVNLIGKIAYIKINKVDAYTLYGELVDVKY